MRALERARYPHARWPLLWLCAVALVACGDDGAPGELRDAGPAGEVRDARTLAQQGDAALVSARDARADGAAMAPSDASRPLDATTTQARDGGRTDASAGDATPRPGWQLVFEDEFDGPSGSLPSADKWVFETGGGGFGNNELEHYTARPENAALDGQGKLVITARAESYMGSKYTSARLKTAGKFEHAYGRYEARLRIPSGQGIWPAFWMLGADIGAKGWPQCGEIDIMENVGKEPALIHGTLHGPGYSGGSAIGKSAELPGKVHFSEDFHEFAVEWEEQAVRWYLDGTLYQTRTPADLPAGAKWVFDHPFFLLLNLAVGGQWPGSPDATTKFPQQLTVDYVRVYDRR
jgi:beta-glucanase (GH16 family)